MTGFNDEQTTADRGRAATPDRPYECSCHAVGEDHRIRPDARQQHAHTPTYTWWMVMLLMIVLAACGTTETVDDIDSEATLEPTATEIAPAESASDAADDEAPFYAWDFTMASVGGAEYTLSDLRGDWVIVNFWATYCGPCVAEMPALQAIADKYEACLLVLGINQREAPEDVLDFSENLGITFPLLLNPDDATLANYQVMALPQTVVVDPNGEIVWRQFGPVELDTFEDQLLALNNDSALCGASA